MIKQEFSSFRDPSGFIYQEDGEIYRKINHIYKNDYDILINSGLYDKLISKKLMLPFSEITSKDTQAYKIIKPEKINFISYPYEWSFSQYKDAALLTLKIQKLALLHKMTLKDASAYNVQFHNGKPVFIDHLSFTQLDESKPWQGYKQFCQHFLAPITLMAKKDINLSNLMKNYIDGIPLDLASKLLPKFTNIGIITNIHMNAFFQNMYSSSQKEKSTIKNMNFQRHITLIEGLYQTIQDLKNPHIETEWGEYYKSTNYSDKSFAEKENTIKQFVKQLQNINMIWDLGANNGHFTKIASDNKIFSIAFDIDPIAVEKNYNAIKKEQQTNILPLVFDLLNPSPAIGWANKERENINNRSKPDLVMALALIHHLSISNNIPFDYIASYLKNLSPYLIIEFVDKQDSQVQKLLTSRDDIFPWYNQTQFEDTFKKYYNIIQKHNISNTQRTLYLLKIK